MNLTQLREARNQAVAKCREISNRVRESGGEWSAEDNAEFQKARKDAEAASAAYLDAKNAHEREQWLTEQDEQDDQFRPEGSRRSNASNPNGGGRNRQTHGALIQWGPENSPRLQRSFQPEGPRGSESYATAFNRYMRGANNAFQDFDDGIPQNLMRADDETQGGFFVMPERMAAGIIRAVDDEVFIQSRARMFIVRGSRSLGFRKRTAKASTFQKGSELGDITESLENSLRFGKRALTPHPFIGSFQISRDLIAAAGREMEQIYIDEVMIDFGEHMELQYMYGTGDSECLGYMTPSDEGVSTARDLRASSATTFTYDDLVTAKYSLKNKYRRNAVWMFHRDYFVTLATMTDPEGHLIWQLSARDDDPDRLLGRPVLESEWMPNTAAADNYYGSFCDFSQYYIAWDSESLETQRLNEIVARRNMVEFHFRGRADAMPILEEGFTRLQFASS